VTRDKYGVEDDPYCYAGTTTLKNLLDLRDEILLSEAERDLTADAAEALEFLAPPYDLCSVTAIHRHLFADVYPWAGELRLLDISKGTTRFCTATRIEPEAHKFFEELRTLNWLEEMSRNELVSKVAELFGDFNVIHPFREGNGRVQRILFENLIINVGYEISWRNIEPDAWVEANIAAYNVDYSPLRSVFEICVGGLIKTDD
jgi:cell filamentation protein